MSVSKLESLPNEILIDLFEKYINSIDVFVAFLGRLNSRFDSLINQCGRFYLDFQQIRKNDFLTCLDVLSRYSDKIEGLRLSEWHTPGEISIFLTAFNSFDQFKYLRVLHFHFNCDTITYEQVAEVIRSLSNTSIHSLSIVLEKRHAWDRSIFGLKGKRNVWYRDDLQRLINVAFKISGLKRLYFNSGNLTFDPDVYRYFNINLKYLNLQNTSIYWVDVKKILSYGRHLKYLNIRLTDEASSPRRIFGLTMGLYSPLTDLRTFIVHFSDPYHTGFHLLIECLRVMPNLTRLKVSSDTKDVYADIWQKLIEKYLPHLTDFLLVICRLDFQENQISNILTLFQTPFWIEKKNFNLIITTAMTEYQFQRLFNKSIDKTSEVLDQRNSWVIDPSIVQLWSAPHHDSNGDIFNRMNINNLNFSTNFIASINQHSFNNVKTLNITHLNKPLIDWMISYINLSRIINVKIWSSELDTDAIISLLSHTTNINLLQISFKFLKANQTVLINKFIELKILDISNERDTFNEEDIKTIACLFPHLSHLKINTIDLYNVPLLNTYLPYLESLTFKMIDSSDDQDADNKEEQRQTQMQQNAQFLFRRTSDWITIWIDQNTYDDPFWRTFQAQVETDDSSNDLETSRKKHKPSSSKPEQN